MELLTALREQISALWARWSMAQRVGLSAAAITCVALVGLTLYWALQDQYVVIAGQLTPQRAAEMKGVLETAQIPAEMNFSGSAISVPVNQVSAARLALKDQLDPLVSDQASPATGMFESPIEKEDRRRRALEARIEKTIGRIRGVRSAQVHVSLPNPSPFVLDKSPSTASVVIEVTPGGGFSADAAKNIVALVSRAVEGLTPENITLMDTQGRQFSAESGLNSAMSLQLEFQRQIENSLARKAETLLTRWLGPDKATVEVTADIDFQEKKRTETVYDAESKVKRKELTDNITQTGTVTLPVGSVGASANIVPDTSSVNSGGGKYNRETSDIEYDNSNTLEVLTEFPGRILRLTVSAVVDPTVNPLPVADSAADPAADPAAAAAAASTASTETPVRDLKQIESLIKQAVGFDMTRGDEFSMITDRLAIVDSPEGLPVGGFNWNEHQWLIQSVSLAMAALVALVIAVLMIKRMRPVVVAPPEEEPLSMADMLRLRALTEQAKSNPEVVASILAAWMGDDEEGDSPRVTPATVSPPAANPARPARRAA
ncbi:MAG: flagellar M-ring protein FliF [Planctomycetaceae bacterium]|nr:flagellar M-ring protein FliF [Planctomycetaceae bacterium]